MSVNREALPEKAVRVQAFARFFKNYMSVSALVTASLPIPLTALGAIPTFKSQTKLFATYTPLFCFLLLGFIFYSRHALGRIMFFDDGRFATQVKKLFVACLPALLIALSLFAAFQYHIELAREVELARARLLLEAVASEAPSWTSSGKALLIPRPDQVETAIQQLVILNNPRNSRATEVIAQALGGYANVVVAPPSTTDALQSGRFSGGGSLLLALYLMMFLCAEGAFILMAVKEYLQDVLGINDVGLIRGPTPADAKPT